MACIGAQTAQILVLQELCSFRLSLSLKRIVLLLQEVVKTSCQLVKTLREEG